MDVLTTVWMIAGGLFAAGLAFIVVAVWFGRQYQAGGNKNHKYICVACTVASCVCIITAIQIYLMFRGVTAGVTMVTQ